MTTISQVTAAPVQPLSPDANVDRQIEFLRKVIKNMTSMSGRKLLIGGDTGIGKTSFAKQFARMLGMPIVIIEIPHIVEEELINIPYIVYDADGGTKEGVEQIPVGTPGESGVKDIKVVMAKSWLAGHLESINKMADMEYQTFVDTQLDTNSKNLLDIYIQEYPDDIKTVRSMYNRILFFDEFFRQSTPTIKNILRNVLNGQIGNDKIPPGTYTMYASNLSDAAHGAIDKQLGNEEYDEPEFKPPTAKEWLDYTVGQSTSTINWHPDVVKAFQDAMSDAAVSYKDANTKIRTSPRRWSDIMIYVNSLYPFKTPRDAGVAQFVLRRQFQDDQRKTSPAYKILEYILNELIKKSGHRKIPVVSGEEDRKSVV
jgi:MoxR-like ATPase